MPDLSIAERFMRVFAGAERSHGTYEEEDPESGGKRTIKRTARTIRAAVTALMWEQHLQGSRPLGIVPIREDDCCWWATLDIDKLGIDLPALAAEVLRLSVPAVVCRSKSGCAHVHLFFSEPIPAAEIIPRMRELAALLGHGDCEVFPKQTTVLAQRGDLGSWLNMPYFGGDKTERFAVRPDGRGMSMEKFLDTAEGVRLSRRGLADLSLSKAAHGFESGPPCLESLIATGFPPGTRNKGVLALGILAKKMSADGWEGLLEKWVREYVSDPPFPQSELAGIVKQLRKKDYHYKCSDTPLNQRCNSQLCRTRPHGVGGGGSSAMSIIDGIDILLTEPPIFFVTVKTISRTVELSASQLLSPHEFQLAVLQQQREVVPEYKRADWLRWVEAGVREARIIKAPKESGSHGKFEELLEQFVTDRHRAETREEVMLGKPWHDENNGHVYFRIRDLETALDRARFTCPDRGMGLRSWITARIRDMEGTSEQFPARGRNVSVWKLRSSLFVWNASPMSLPPREEGPL